jgi:translation initiation factor 3 subunit D
VDSRPVQTKGSGRGKSFGRGKGRGRGIAVNYQEGILGQKQKPVVVQQQQTKGKSKGKGGQQRRALPSFKEWSVQTSTQWEVKREIALNELTRLVADGNQVQFEDLKWCGKLHDYNKQFDRITVKSEKPLKRFESLHFFNVTTSDDPHLPEMLQEDPTVTVIATDHVLAALAASARSVYSWDIVVSKVQGKLIFDKREGSPVDYLTVNETAQEPPNNDDPESMNAPAKLGIEASCINMNFSQMVLELDKPPREMEEPNPFAEEDELHLASSGAYRYRKITLPGNSKSNDEFKQTAVNMIVRTEVNCTMPGSADSYASVKGINEYDPKVSSYPWRTSLESQRGACLANEIKNNNFKLGRWTAQAMLAGCGTMKIGYASRAHPSDPWNHSILGVHSHLTEGFAEQIGMTRNNLFGILRNFIDAIMEFEDGKYLIIKDPTKPVIRIYLVPWETFNEPEEEGDDEEEEEELNIDEDGNVAPQQPA